MPPRSFLPGFKGARPCLQAHHRDVKPIGATVHHVTPDLDEGPITGQDAVRVDHSHDPDEPVTLGRAAEAQVLARAVQRHSESRVPLHGHPTAAFH